MNSIAKKKSILFWMCFSLFVCYLPWYSFSAMLEQITIDLALSSSEIGQILAAFQLGYVVTVIFSGWLGDKIGTKRIVLIASCLTWLFAVLTPLFAVNTVTLMLFRIATGCASGAIYAPGMSLLSSWYRPEERGFAIGAYTSALVSSYAISYLTGGYLVTYLGWRVGMFLTAMPSFLGVLAIFLFVDPPTPPKPLSSLWSHPSLSVSYAALHARIKDLYQALGEIKKGYLSILAYLGHMWELYTFWGWIGIFLTAQFYRSGMSKRAATTRAGIVTALILFLGAFSSYFFSKWSDDKGRGNTILLCSLASIVGELFLGLLFGTTIWFLILLVCWTGFWIVADSAIHKTVLTELVPREIETTALGIQSALGFALTIPSNFFFGHLLDYANARVPPIEATAWFPSFFLLVIGGCFAPIFSLLLRTYEQETLIRE